MARGRKSSLRIVLFSEERQTLERWQRSATLPLAWSVGGGVSSCWQQGPPNPLMDLAFP
jgi:hypothetical protein